MPDILLSVFQRLSFVCGSRFHRSILKRERNHLDWLLYIFSILEVKMEMLMNRFEVRDSLWYFRNKCALTDAASRNGPHFLSSSLLSLRFPLHHSLNSFGQIIICIFSDDLLQNSLSSFLLFCIDTIDQIYLTVPRHRSRCEFKLWSWKVAVDLIWFRLH